MTTFWLHEPYISVRQVRGPNTAQRNFHASGDAHVILYGGVTAVAKEQSLDLFKPAEGH